MRDKLYDSCRFDWINMICEQIGTADFYAGNESPQQYILTSMQNSHDTFIFLDKHKLQFRLKVHNIATLQQQG